MEIGQKTDARTRADLLLSKSRIRVTKPVNGRGTCSGPFVKGGAGVSSST